MSIKSFLRFGVDWICFDVLDVDFICPFGQAVYDGTYWPVNRSLVIPALRCPRNGLVLVR